MTTRTRIAAAAAASLALAGSGAGIASAVGEAERPQGEAPPYSKRCAIEIRAYEDGSASLYCGERLRPFAAVDAESGRIRFYRD
ncbi:MAG: hypothetical protein H0W09_01970 [Solirubrobacterales bacterium]|nr:hypothetical protein [Solirubrobacterales bacterium]